MMIRAFPIRALVLAVATAAFSTAVSGQQVRPERSPSAQETHPLRFPESRWLRVDNGESRVFADVSADTAGITHANGQRQVWVRHRLRRARSSGGRTADTIIERRQVDCAAERWGTLEFFLVLEGAEIARESEPYFTMPADYLPQDRAVVDLVCAGRPPSAR